MRNLIRMSLKWVLRSQASHLSFAWVTPLCSARSPYWNILKQKFWPLDSTLLNINLGALAMLFVRTKIVVFLVSFAFAVFVHEVHEILKNFANRRIQLRTRTCNAFCTNKILAKLTLKNVCEDLVCYAFFAQINSKIFTPTFLFSKNRR